MDIRIPIQAIKGRGSSQALAHRYAREAREALDDGWGSLDEVQAQQHKRAAEPTTWTWESPRSLITRNRSPDIGFDLSINPYRGCEHGCCYCYARPSHSYLGWSPGLDFETRLVAKRDPGRLLRAELARSGYRPGLLALGTVTDAYQPLERELGLSREILQVLHDCHHPVAIVTKGHGIERDIDLLAPMAARGLAGVYITLTTLDAKLARQLEPRAPAPWRRLRTIRTLSAAGIPVGVSVAPQIPFINEDMEQVLQAAREAGASRAFYTVLRLPWELSPLFRQWLDQHFPDRAARVMARIQDLRGGKDYDARFGARMQGRGLWADLLAQRFAVACRQLGFGRERHPWDVSQFTPPTAGGQIQLF